MVNMSKKFTGWEERTLLQQMVFDELDVCTEKNKASTQYQIILRTEKILGENHCDLGIGSVYIYIYIYTILSKFKNVCFSKDTIKKTILHTAKNSQHKYVKLFM